MFDQHTYLYVEDDALSRIAMKTIFERVLKSNGLTIFSDSADFMQRVRSLPARPEVFMLDIHVEPHSGFEMLEMLRSDPDYTGATVVALTASVMNEEIERLRTAGFDSTIAKPLIVHQFPQLMRQILNGEPVWHIA
ncbi:MAG: response regulator [Chloroflexi bacterium]|nr:response regulator [Chloroflexota bacterium]